MREIIKDGQVVQDAWRILRIENDDEAHTVNVPQGSTLVPLRVWLAQSEALSQRKDIGVWLASDERPETLADNANRFAVIAIDFPKFTDGRGYSLALLLRARYKFTGELRAIGDVLRDQLFYMQRVGFNAFAVRADRDIHDALKGLSDFSEPYQASWHIQHPLYQRVERRPNHG